MKADTTAILSKLKNISLDPVSGEIISSNGRTNFVKLMSRMLYAYWPDWKGQFHAAYPSVPSSTDNYNEYITFKIISEEPMKVDTTFGRGGAPGTKTPAKGLIQPKCLINYQDNSKNDLVEVWTESHDVIIMFEVFTKNTMEAQELSNRFMQFIRETRHMYIKEHINNLVWLKYSEDKDQNTKYDESYRQTYLLYWFQYEDVYVIRIPTIQAVAVTHSLAALREPSEREQIYLNIAKGYHDQTISVTASDDVVASDQLIGMVSNSYSQLSMKTSDTVS